MAKRKKGKRSKPRLSAAQLYRPGIEATSVVGAEEEVKAKHVVGGSSRMPTEAELIEEYRYVLNDLKRIGMLAVVMLAVLIILALVLV